MSYSLSAYFGDSWDTNVAYLYLNDGKLEESRHRTYTGISEVQSTGGREVTLEASAGDTIYLRTTEMESLYNNIYYCAEYIPKM